MAAPSLDEIRKLSVAERIQLVEDIWDSIAASQAEVPLTEAQREDLDRRIEAYEADPDAGSSWEDVEKRIQGRE
jgi:putative addiction module component (TIGR02574 family)